jgi:hypothetical protein
MPVILNDTTRDLWLDTDTTFGKVYAKIYETNPKDLISYHKVASVVNSIKNDSDDCTMEIEEYKKKVHARGIGRFFGNSDKKLEPEEIKPNPKHSEPKTLSGNKVQLLKNAKA